MRYINLHLHYITFTLLGSVVIPQGWKQMSQDSCWMERHVVGLPQGCGKNVEIKMHFTVMLLLLSPWQKKYPSATSLQSYSHLNVKYVPALIFMCYQ